MIFLLMFHEYSAMKKIKNKVDVLKIEFEADKQLEEGGVSL